MTNEETAQSAVSDPAGQQLRRAREALGLSLEAVADAQHLRPSVIQNIENGHYEAIDSELFLKGYVRAYAKQVGLNAEALIATLDQELEPLREKQAREVEDNPLRDIERKKRQKRRIARSLGWLLLVLVVLYSISVYLDRPSAPESPAGESGGEAPPEAAGEPEAPAINQDPVDVVDDTGVEAPEPLSGADPDTVDDVTEPEREPEPETESEPEPPMADQPVTGSESGSGESGDQPVETTPSADNAVPTVEQQPESALAVGPLEEPAAPSVSLEMSFTGDCWVQVTDANGDRLVASLKRSGDRVSVEGVPPMQVVIGAVDALSVIRFDNEPVDMNDVRVFNNRAELTLDI